MDQQEFSSLVSLALDSMGYGYETVKLRQLLDIDLSEDEFSPSENDDVRTILVGSTAEGISQPLSPNSDLDYMIVHSDIVVIEDIPDTNLCHDNDVELLQMECDEVAPGYTMIKCLDMESTTLYDIIQPSGFESIDILEINDSYYLRHSLNEMFHEHLRASPKKDTEREEDKAFCKISGPALTAIYEATMSCLKYTCSFDFVLAIPCFCTIHIRNWVNRTRHYGWPTKELLSKSNTQVGYVVPVGFKGSENFELEWRICYTELELILIRSLNETQIKVYVLLKMVAKGILKPICKDITSYVIKNLVLWIVERNAKEIFTPENLTSLLMLGLRSLRNKVDIRLFGCYMIPERNLFAGKITEHEKVEIVSVLDRILAQGPMFLMNFKELNRLKIAVDENCYNPLLAEMKTQLWHYYSLVPLNEIANDDEYDMLFLKVFVGTILVTKDLELDEHKKVKLKEIFVETEKACIGKTFDDFCEDIAEDLEENFDSLFENEEVFPSMVLEFCALQ